MHKVDFFIIGAQKAGTTSLYKYLAEHPEIFMPEIKENHFFCEERFYNKGEDFFHRYYSNYNNQKIIGGAYVHMLSSPEAPERVFAYNKNAKILLMLRNPIDRAYSAYHFALENGWESSNVSFVDSLKLQQKRVHGNYTDKTDLSYFYSGLYYQHICNWLKFFPKESIYILLFDDLKENPEHALKQLFNYLGVSDRVAINTNIAHNKSRGVKYKNLHYFIRNKESGVKRIMASVIPFKLRYVLRTKVRRAIDKVNITEKKYEPLSDEQKKIVFKYFEEDVKLLSKFMNRDLYECWKPK